MTEERLYGEDKKKALEVYFSRFSEEVDDLFEVMGVLEALSGELAAKKATNPDIAEVKALHYQMVLHFTRKELIDYFHLNQRIHEKILEISGNKILMSMYQTLQFVSVVHDTWQIFQKHGGRLRLKNMKTC